MHHPLQRKSDSTRSIAGRSLQNNRPDLVAKSTARNTKRFMSKEEVVLQKWKLFLKENMERTTIGGPDKKFYRASEKDADEKRTNSGETKDWGGRYLATTLDQAKGYLVPKDEDVEKKQDREMIISCYTFEKPLEAVKIPAAFTKTEEITEEDKVALLKDELGIGVGPNCLLLNALGFQSKVYVGDGGDDGIEVAMAWDLKPPGMLERIMKGYTVKYNGEVV